MKTNRTQLKVLEGAPNFRDIGGLITVNGLSMKSGVLYRSDELSKLTNNDFQVLTEIGLKMICDLRTEKERKNKIIKNNFSPEIKIINIPIHHGEVWNFVQFLWFITVKAKKVNFEEYSKKMYRHFAFGSTSEIKRIFSLVIEKNNQPFLLHCSTGKDRTGFISALFQLVAGVSREKVIEEYLETNHHIKNRTVKLTKYLRYMSLFQLSENKLLPLLEAKKIYLEETINEIYKKYGSIESYLIKACFIKNEDIITFKKLTLQS